MKILITGGCGFVGANLIPWLLQQGHTIRVLDNLSSGTRAYLEGSPYEWIEGDIRSWEDAQKACRGVDAVVHLAAQSGIADSVTHPEKSFEANAMGTLLMLKAAAREKAKNFIVASSNAALGEHKPPLHEKILPRPVSPYGATKLASEAAASAFSHTYGLNTVVLRFANLYGPFCGHKSSAVATFIRRAKAGQPLLIYGDGRQTRDFVHVSDICQAIQKCLTLKSQGEIFQIGTGLETPVLRLATLIRKLAMRSAEKGTAPVAPLQFQPVRPGEVRRNYSSIAKAIRVLKYRPKMVLSGGLEALWNEEGLRSAGGIPNASRPLALSGDL